MLTTASLLCEFGLHQCDNCSVVTVYDLLLQTEMLGKSEQENTLFCCSDIQVYIGLM